MRYWTIKSCPLRAIKPLTKRCAGWRRSANHYLLLTALLVLQSALVGADSMPDYSVSLAPHQAIYTSSAKGISAELKQTLKNLGSDHWQLHNRVSMLLAGFEEQASFSENNGTIVPSKYHYQNQLSRKRDSKLNFNWRNNTVTDSLHGNKPLTVPANALDKLSFQMQLRLDFLNQNTPFNEQSYLLVDKKRLKNYQIKYLGDEIIDTPAGTFNAIKLEQRRPGKDKSTLIWLARDWDYFILRIRRMDKAKTSYQVELKQATIDGRPITGIL